MFAKHWKTLAVIGVLIWSLVNLFQVVPTKQYDEYKKLASMTPQEVQLSIIDRLNKTPGYDQMKPFQREELRKSLLEESQVANNIQEVGKVGDYHILTNLKLGLDLRGGSQLVLRALPTPLVPKITPEVMTAVETVINNRVNSLGVSETIVQKAGADRLIVELPGIKDPQAAKDRIGTTALLEFKELLYDANGIPLRDKDGYYVWKDVGLTGADFQRAQGVQMMGGENWRITFTFKPTGATKFGQLTQRMVGKQIGIFLDGQPTERGPDGQPMSMAEYNGINVREPIMGGDGEITGRFTKEQAIDLSMKLNAGSLPTKIEILEERTVGATLGQDSIEKSMVAGVVGIACVMFFMVAIYGLPGMVANIALVLYTLTTLAIFKVTPVTLTLAGIAGFILSVGMAVDANILIFERTKEEVKSGKNLYSAIEAGFGRAFTSIFDSNMNSLIACGVLMVFGTSIVKGFAVTLGIGVAVSMFTAITATRVLLHLIPKNVTIFGAKLGGKKDSEKKTLLGSEVKSPTTTL